MTSNIKTGGCQCGGVRYTADVTDAAAYLCHCKMCQKATGGFAATFVFIRADAVEWAGEPDWYASSPIAKRPYCRGCGTSLGFRFNEGSENMDLSVASFDDPSRFTPKWHFGAESIQRPWLNTDGLPEHKSTDYDVLVNKWIEATGKVPD